MEKKKVVIEYSKLPEDLLAVYEETYPTGIAGKTIRFPNAKGEIVTAVRIETDDTIYLVKVMAKPKEVLTEEQMDELIKPTDKADELNAEEEEEEKDADKSTGNEED
jgi:hypothetical protein